MILVFDLDDTLYEELTYVKSSFRAVAGYLSIKFGLSESDVYQEFITQLENEGRGQIFNKVLIKNGVFSKKELRNCLSVYRTSKPDIVLTEEAKNCLKRFQNVTKYLVTDGNKIVQRAKISALGLKEIFKKTLPTHNFGIHRAKPSTYVFHKILEWESASPEQLIYVGDNPKKDFVNLKQEGFKTIRVLTGNHRSDFFGSNFEAHLKINDLSELTHKKIGELYTC